MPGWNVLTRIAGREGIIGPDAQEQQAGDEEEKQRDGSPEEGAHLLPLAATGEDTHAKGHEPVSEFSEASRSP